MRTKYTPIFSNLVALSTFLLLISGCAPTVKTSDYASLIKSSSQARSLGHEDLAANDLKEAFEKLPGKGDSKRIEAVNQLYPEILALSQDLKKSGRISLSKTLLDLAIEIESECTIVGKRSAAMLKKESDDVFDIEEKILAGATTSNGLKTKIDELEKITTRLKADLQAGDYKRVAADGVKHMEVVRTASGTASSAYRDARDTYIDALEMQKELTQAITLLERDAKELNTFSHDDLKSGNEDSFENAYFLTPLFGKIARLQERVGELESAHKNATRQIKLAKLLGGKMTVDLAIGQIILAGIEKEQGKFREALQLVDRTTDLLDSAGAPRAVRIYALRLQAELNEQAGKIAQADGAYKVIIEKSEKVEPRETIKSLASAAAFYRSQNDEKMFQRLKTKIVALSDSKGEFPDANALAFEKLGDSAAHVNKSAEALSWYQKALLFASDYQKHKLEKKISAFKKS